MSTKKIDHIEIVGARAHNLKNVSISLKRGDFIVFTGLSGSGKSSLAFDTLYAEGQRRYVESLSSYARQFLGKIEKPAVDHINGISPAIAIEQKVHSRNPRSTVGTSTEIYEYLKLLFARTGKTFDPISGVEVKKHSHLDVLSYIQKFKTPQLFYILAPIQNTPQPEIWLKTIKTKGYSRLFYKKEVIRIEDFKIPKKLDFDDLFLLIDRFESQSEDDDRELRMVDAIQAAFYEGRNKCSLFLVESEKFKTFNKDFEHEGRSFMEPSLHLFSFNNPLGACPKCEGFGSIIGIDPDLVIPDKSLSLYQGAVACWKGEKMKTWLDQLILNADKNGIQIHQPYSGLSQEQKNAIWDGGIGFEGIWDFFQFLSQNAYKIQYRVMLSRYKGKTKCPECTGTRLRKDSQYIKVGGKNMGEIVTMSVHAVYEFITSLKLNKQEQEMTKRLMFELKNRLSYLMDVGLGYLQLNRGSNTLSGGESQRIQLSTSLGSSLVGSMYILDEPSIGLHPRDTVQLIQVMRKLNQLGNTLIVVEHDEDIMQVADEIVDLGPEAGLNGGNVVFQGSHADMLKSNTLTAQYLSGKLKIEIPNVRRKWRNYIGIVDAYQNNLKHLNVKIPLKVLTCVTGVSGSGKSSLMNDILYKGLHQKIVNNAWGTADYEKFEGQFDAVDQIELIDQNPIGKSSRSNPVTYLKAFDEIRALFSSLPEVKLKGVKPSHFSFNVDGGRCDTCKGEGEITVEMQFMSDIKLTCDECKGHRFKEEILEIKFNGKNISDILNMTIAEALDFFAKAEILKKQCQKIIEKLNPLNEVGLDYIHLGQSSNTLSGGEAQRVKLAYFLSKKNQKESILFLFDEPSTGLHFHDIKKLLVSLNALIARGHTVVVIEHHLDIIKCADWVIDLGPEGGDAGGHLVFEGLPEDLIKEKKSYTGQFLKSKFK